MANGLCFVALGVSLHIREFQRFLRVRQLFMPLLFFRELIDYFIFFDEAELLASHSFKVGRVLLDSVDFRAQCFVAGPQRFILCKNPVQFILHRIVFQRSIRSEKNPCNDPCENQAATNQDFFAVVL